ncbi:MAG: hypothetical protein U0167_09920 [bacterium]
MRAGLLALPVWVASCDDDTPCTLMPCSDGFTLTLRHASLRFPAGEYTVRVTPSGGAVTECSFAVSDDTGVCASGHCVSSTSCDGVFFVGYPGNERVELRYPALTPPVLVEVGLDGTAAANEVLDLEYELFWPNGHSCPPPCLVASGEVMIPTGPPNKRLQRTSAEDQAVPDPTAAGSPSVSGGRVWSAASARR